MCVTDKQKSGSVFGSKSKETQYQFNFNYYLILNVIKSLSLMKWGVFRVIIVKISHKFQQLIKKFLM